MICLRGTPAQFAFLSEIIELKAGIELGSYGMVGVQSEQDWKDCFTRHKAISADFSGMIAVHGPFIGMEYNHLDYILRQAVNQRLDMIFEAAKELKACRVILHNDFNPVISLFKLEEYWLERKVSFWKEEIKRWADAGIEIVLENMTEPSPDLLVQLVDEVDNSYLGICLDVGHHHLFAEIGVAEWVQKTAHRLSHIHLHDNDRSDDKHWPPGQGTVDFNSLYAAVLKYVPQVTLSLEVSGDNQVKMGALRKLAAKFPG